MSVFEGFTHLKMKKQNTHLPAFISEHRCIKREKGKRESQNRLEDLPRICNNQGTKGGKQF